MSKETLIMSKRGRVDAEQADELLEVMMESLDALLDEMNFLHGPLQDVKVFKEAPIATPEPANKRTPMTLVTSA